MNILSAINSFDSFPIAEDGIIYDILQERDLDGSAKCISKAFTGKYGEPMTKCLGISEDDFFVFAELFCKKAIKDELSIVAKNLDTRKVIGCSISEDFITEPPEGLDSLDSKFLPIFSLLTQLDETYKKRHHIIKNEILHEFMLGINLEYRKQGLSDKILKITHKLGILSGYKGAIAEVTGPGSQHLLIKKNNYLEISQINYKEFKFEQEVIFKTITECENCILVYKKLE